MKKEYVELNADSLHSANLANQSQGRDLDTNEKALAKALMSIFENGVHDFKDVAAALSSMKVIAPRSGLKDWTIDLLNEELIETNNQLDLAYKENGFGA
ncbi:MAG: hypothetical protein MK386_06285 [Candidatus Thioglobus autotrophicus]|jgi:hypothetical protein|nr:hypothetical protein [Candidatus Thioglobus autotrophicus]